MRILVGMQGGGMLPRRGALHATDDGAKFPIRLAGDAAHFMNLGGNSESCPAIEAHEARNGFVRDTANHQPKLAVWLARNRPHLPDLELDFRSQSLGCSLPDLLFVRL